MRESRSQFVIWDQIGGGNYIMIAHGEGVYEKKEGFRSRREAEEWIERRLRLHAYLSSGGCQWEK